MHDDREERAYLPHWLRCSFTRTHTPRWAAQHRNRHRAVKCVYRPAAVCFAHYTHAPHTPRTVRAAHRSTATPDASRRRKSRPQMRLRQCCATQDTVGACVSVWRERDISQDADACFILSSRTVHVHARACSETTLSPGRGSELFVSTWIYCQKCFKKTNKQRKKSASDRLESWRTLLFSFFVSSFSF